MIAKNNGDLPSVIEVDGQYFLDGDWIHWLTIAKVLGGKKAQAVVRKANKWQMK